MLAFMSSMLAYMSSIVSLHVLYVSLNVLYVRLHDLYLSPKVFLLGVEEGCNNSGTRKYHVKSNVNPKLMQLKYLIIPECCLDLS